MWFTPLLQAAELNSFPDWPYTPSLIQLESANRLHNLLADSRTNNLINSVTYSSFPNTLGTTSSVTSSRLATISQSDERVASFNSVRVPVEFSVTRTFSFLRGA